jgi:hypothetical protein
LVNFVICSWRQRAESWAQKGGARRLVPFGDASEHDPEKWPPVFG